MDRIVPVSGLITSKIGVLVDKIVNELTNPSKYPINVLARTLESDPVSAACIQLKSSRASQLLGDYCFEEEPEIQGWIRDVLKNTDDSLFNITAKMYSAAPFGFSMGEIWFDNSYSFPRRRIEWVMKGINPLDPSQINVRTKNGKLYEIKYSEDTDKIIPIWKIIHIVNNLTVPFGQKSVFGNPEMARAYPYIKLKQLIFAEMGIAGKTRATGIVVGKTDSNSLVVQRNKKGEPIIGSNGKPKSINAVEALSNQLIKLENHPYLVTDKNNDISSLQIPAGERFWDFAKNLVDEQIMRSFLVPQLIWSEGSGALGLGALSNTQLTVLDSSILPLVQDIRDQLIDKAIKRLIIWNFGKKKSYGEFKHTPKNDPNQESLITQTLVQALTTGLISTGDQEAMNALREKLRLKPVSNEMQAFHAELQGQLARIKAAQEAVAERDQMLIQAQGQKEIEEIVGLPAGQLPPEQQQTI